MTHLRRNPAARCALIATALAAGFLMSCGTKAPVERGAGDDAYENAVGFFVAGDYSRAAKALESYLDATTDPANKLRAYYYLGRSYLELGDRNRAFGAFQMAVMLGDEGPSREYYERLSGGRAADAGLLSQVPAVTRFQFAALTMTLAGGEAFDAKKDDPIDAMIARGWLTKLPDGSRREDTRVTQAAFYVTVARILAERGLPGGAVVFTGKPWNVDPISTKAVSGRIVVEVMERVARFGEEHGG